MVVWRGEYMTKYEHQTCQAAVKLYVWANSYLTDQTQNFACRVVPGIRTLTRASQVPKMALTPDIKEQIQSPILTQYCSYKKSTEKL